MPILIEGDCFDDVYTDVMLKLVENPEHVCRPRGQLIKEVLGATLVVENPRARLILCPTRKANYGFATGEFLWYWTGKEDLETMLYYSKRLREFSDDGQTLNSAYGLRIRHQRYDQQADPPRFPTQWDVCRETLIADHDSRRALMLINRPEDQVRAQGPGGSKDVPCTLSLQFFIRDKKLDLHVNMRSNDAVWGLVNDLYSFTLFQECMLEELRCSNDLEDLELGRYVHHAGSLHLYERHFEMASEYIDSSWVECPPMGPLDRWELSHLVGVEHLIRTGTGISSERVEFWNDVMKPGSACRQMLQWLIEHREKRDAECERA
jgi:thymidylate synthase